MENIFSTILNDHRVRATCNENSNDYVFGVEMESASNYQINLFHKCFFRCSGRENAFRNGILIDTIFFEFACLPRRLHARSVGFVIIQITAGTRTFLIIQENFLTFIVSIKGTIMLSRVKYTLLLRSCNSSGSIRENQFL